MASIGLTVLAYGMVYGRDAGNNYLVAVLGGIIVLTGLFAWAMEPSVEPEEPVHVAAAPPDAGEPTPALVPAGAAAAADDEDDGERIPRNLLTGGQAPEEDQ